MYSRFTPIDTYFSTNDRHRQEKIHYAASCKLRFQIDTSFFGNTSSRNSDTISINVSTYILRFSNNATPLLVIYLYTCSERANGFSPLGATRELISIAYALSLLQTWFGVE